MYVKLLHCWRSLFVHASCTTNCLCNLIKERFTLEFFISESGCKGNHFLYLLPNFIKTFFEVFFRKVFVGKLLTANCKESLLGSIIFTLFPLSICQLLRLLPCGSGCKSTLFIFTLQIFLPLFLWISLECYRIVTQVTYTLLFKRQNFFSFFRFFFYLFVFLFSDIA